METMTIHVREATEEKPIQSLEAFLLEMNEVERALVDIGEGEVAITYDADQISGDQLTKRIQLEGYHVL
ncbi:heavy-metal-associated domain-containing protein [Planococcus sp. YIM B11945]|uniref:heavy-metal-associated domain-containing protein n=1 Tax=Planococcus sp. YIM B11945 TaxID=3435410 RepID=UPI003D7D3A1F